MTPAKTRQSQVIMIVIATLGLASWLFERDWLLGLAIAGLGIAAIWYGLAVGRTGHEPGLVGAGISKLPSRAGRIAWVLLGVGIMVFGIFAVVIDLS